jgi:hypothetical protein
MGGKASAPPPPDYSGIAAASERSAELSYAMGQDQLAWAKEQYAMDSEVIDRVVSDSLNRAQANDAAAASDRARYEATYQPLEDELVRDAQLYSTPSRQEYESGRAMASVAEQFELARQNATRNLEAYGVDPSSTRYAALDLGSRVQEAAAKAGASNQARMATEAMGRAMRSEAINVGRGYPGQIAGTYATALQSGNSAANAQLAGTASGASTMGTGAQWQGLGNQALGVWGNTLNMSHQNQIDTFNANQNASSGIGGLLGVGLGIAQSGIAEGGVVPAHPPGTPGSGQGVTPGGNVPAHASPTRGAAIDDVPARLNVGEFVVPNDVVAWKGEEFFQKVIEGSRKAKPEAPAKPTTVIAPPEQPTFSTAPRGALPVR